MIQIRYGRMGYGPGFMMIPMVILTIILLIALIFLLVKIFKKGNNNTLLSSSASADTTSKALEILNNRYASGEITDEEYKNKKELLLK